MQTQVVAQPEADLPFLLRAAIWWNRVGVRGRAAIPRFVGRMWGEQELFISTRHGGRLSVDLANLDVYAYIYNSGGQWDAHVLGSCERLLREGDVFYDIGSNTGLFAIDAAVLVPNLTVYAFEPQPSLAHHIEKSIEASKLARVTCLQMMLGNEEGEKILHMTSHSIHASIVPREKNFRELRCPMHRIDNLVASGRIEAPDVIKIDVEGAETIVFSGAQETLKSSGPSVIFEADENLGRLGLQVEAVFDSLQQAVPYQFYEIQPDGNLSLAQRPYRYGNYLALSPRHSDRLAAPAH